LEKPAELIRAAINIIGHDVEMASFEFAAIDQHLLHAIGAHLGEVDLLGAIPPRQESIGHRKI
jgi:hypothetical protein